MFSIKSVARRSCRRRLGFLVVASTVIGTLRQVDMVSVWICCFCSADLGNTLAAMEGRTASSWGRKTSKEHRLPPVDAEKLLRCACSRQCLPDIMFQLLLPAVYFVFYVLVSGEVVYIL